MNKRKYKKVKAKHSKEIQAIKEGIKSDRYRLAKDAIKKSLKKLHDAISK